MGAREGRGDRGVEGVAREGYGRLGEGGPSRPVLGVMIQWLSISTPTRARETKMVDKDAGGADPITRTAPRRR